jgi:hypothetical protein
MRAPFYRKKKKLSSAALNPPFQVHEKSVFRFTKNSPFRISENSPFRFAVKTAYHPQLSDTIACFIVLHLLP